MRTLSLHKKIYFLDLIQALHQQLDEDKPNNTLDHIDQFENRLTLNELEECIINSTDENQTQRIVRFLSQRWERIRGSRMCYTNQPNNSVNQLCHELAIASAPLVTAEEEMDSLAPKTGPYFLLMPTLDNHLDVSADNIHLFSLHEVVLSENGKVLIPLAKCLNDAFVSDEGQFRQIVGQDGKYFNLTSLEKNRIEQHSKQTNEYYQAIVTYNKQRLLSEDIGAKLTQLIVALRAGGAHRSGEELNAGQQANLGILEFNKYWEGLPAHQKSAVLDETPALKELLERLFRPSDVNYKSTAFCVELIAMYLDPLVTHYNKRPALEQLKNKALAKKKHFERAISHPHEWVKQQKSGRPLYHLLGRIFKLSPIQQQEMFKESGYENALMYALAEAPESLHDFELDEGTKKKATLMKFTKWQNSGIHIAALKGETEAIELLLSWGADIESCNGIHATALHITATAGNVQAVHCLLEKGASLEARTDTGNTALIHAVGGGKEAVVNLLLDKHALISSRNNVGLNALDFAISHQPKLVKPILLKLATRSLEEQMLSLLNVPGGPYPNVLFYAARNDMSLFPKLVDEILKQPQNARDEILNATNQFNQTPLILAAQLGQVESLRKLLDAGVNIESQDINGDTALNWAVYNENLEVTNVLLDKQANINVRNHHHGLNALELAIRNKNTHLIEPLLARLEKLSLNEQCECLREVSGGLYDDVKSYYAMKKPHLLSSQDPGVTQILSKMGFDNYLHEVGTNYLSLRQEKNNPKYIEATTAYKTLFKALLKAKITLYESVQEVKNKERLFLQDISQIKTLLRGKKPFYNSGNKEINQCVIEFKKACQKAIEEARPVLKRPLTPTFSFFSSKTQSETLIDEINEAMQTLDQNHFNVGLK